MIGQQLGLLYLVPIALEELQTNLFIEADFYEGDLLGSVLNVDASFGNRIKIIGFKLTT